MPIRILKVILVICVGLQALFYALQNIVNLEAAHAVMSVVLSMADHEYYPNPLLSHKLSRKHQGLLRTWRSRFRWTGIKQLNQGSSLE